MLRQGPYITVYIYTERFVIMQVLWGLTTKCFEGNQKCDKISAVFSTIKTNKILYNKNKIPENLCLFMALVKKGPFFMAFYGHKI